MGNATRPIVSSQQGNSQNVGHVLNDDPSQSTPQHFGNLIEIFFVPFGQDNGLDTRTKGGQGFFLKPANGQYSTAQRNSPVIATSRLTGRFVNAEIRAVATVIPADGPSLGIAPAGTWM